MNGAQWLCDALKRHGVQNIFGLPGAQNAMLYSALRRSPLHTVVANNETSAAFAAMGYAATSGEPGVVALIGGPGFSLALMALLEALHGSVPIVCLTFVRRDHERNEFRTQHIDHKTIGAVACKHVMEMHTRDEMDEVLSQAFILATGDEPGPVLVLVDPELLASGRPRVSPSPPVPGPRKHSSGVAQAIHQHLTGHQKTLIFAGRGAIKGASQLRALAEKYGTPVITTTSARGVIPEDHPLSVPVDLVPAKVVNEFITQFDRVIALGVKFGENSSIGYRLELPKRKLIHVDASSKVVGANYPTMSGHVADIPLLLEELMALPTTQPDMSVRSNPDLQRWRERFSATKSRKDDPVIHGVQPPTPEAFFAGLKSVLPDDVIMVTDSGLHQMLVRKYFTVRDVNGLLLPANFQSMGFGIPAAIGAKLASPHRPVIAMIGDGGLRMSGLDLLTAASQRLAITVVVFEDGYYSHVRIRQMAYDGKSFGVDLPPMDYAAFADSVNVEFFDGSRNPLAAIQSSLQSNRTGLVEISLGETRSTKYGGHEARLRTVGKRMLGQRVTNWIRHRH